MVEGVLGVACLSACDEMLGGQRGRPQGPRRDPAGGEPPLVVLMPPLLGSPPASLMHMCTRWFVAMAACAMVYLLPAEPPSLSSGVHRPASATKGEHECIHDGMRRKTARQLVVCAAVLMAGILVEGMQEHLFLHLSSPDAAGHESTVGNASAVVGSLL